MSSLDPASLPREELVEKVKLLASMAARAEELEAELQGAMAEVSRQAKELAALKKSSRAILEQEGFKVIARAIFDFCKDLIGATSGYVALLSDDGQENEVLFLEAGGLPCSVDPALPMPIRGLRAESYRDHKAVYHNDFMNSEWVDFMPAGHVHLQNVMFAPLVLDGKAVGLVGLANKPEDFDDADADTAASFGELAAIALQNSRNLDEKNRIAAQREELIQELRTALDNVKTLTGLLPVCSICKKVRDDKGYWERVDSYIESHSEAQITHSLCPTCIKENYPELAEEMNQTKEA